MYLYKKTIFIDTSAVHGIDITQNNADKSDWETNYKADATHIDEVIVLETTFVTDEITWATFKSLVTTPYSWDDVKYTNGGGKYDIYLTSSEPLI